MGQCCCTCCAFSHLRMQCIWKQWEHCPHTRGQSSPGTLQSGQQPLNAILQMPQFSSLATQSQVATPFQHLIFTFMTAGPLSNLAAPRLSVASAREGIKTTRPRQVLQKPRKRLSERTAQAPCGSPRAGANPLRLRGCYAGRSRETQEVTPGRADARARAEARFRARHGRQNGYVFGRHH